MTDIISTSIHPITSMAQAQPGKIVQSTARDERPGCLWAMAVLPDMRAVITFTEDGRYALEVKLRDLGRSLAHYSTYSEARDRLAATIEAVVDRSPSAVAAYEEGFHSPSV